MDELTLEEIQYIRNKKAIEEKEKQIIIIEKEKEDLLVAKDEEKKTIIAEKDTAIQIIQEEINTIIKGK